MRKIKTSLTRQLANRSNAAKSTGPRTESGKAIVSQNAVACGFYGGDIVLKPFDPAGTAEEFAALRQALFDDLAPVGQLQCVIVERIAAILWRQRRAYRLESQAILEPEKTMNPIGDALRAAFQKATQAPPQLFPYGPDFDKLIRYETLIDRQLHRALAQLFRARKESEDRDQLINEINEINDEMPPSMAENPPMETTAESTETFTSHRVANPKGSTTIQHAEVASGINFDEGPAP